MTDTPEHATWPAPRTARQRTAVQNAVVRLFEMLAPDGSPLRPDQGIPDRLRRHRSPRGCILQGSAHAVTISWFGESARDAGAGELRVIAWDGVVSRPGSATRSRGAVVVSELILNPVERSEGEWEWSTPAGVGYNTASLVAFCLALLGSDFTSPDTAAPPL